MLSTFKQSNVSNRYESSKIKKLETDFFINWFSNKLPIVDIQKAMSIVFTNTDIDFNKLPKKLFVQEKNVIRDLLKAFDHKIVSNYNPIQFIEHIHQYMPNTSTAILDAYKEVTGNKLEYNDDSPIYWYYKYWSMKTLWTLEEAICLVSGISTFDEGDDGYRHFHEPLLTYNRTCFNNSIYRLLWDLAIASIESNNLETYSSDFNSSPPKHKLLPKTFLQWASSKGIRRPNPVLVKYTGYDEMSHCKSSYKTSKDEILTNLPCLKKERKNKVNHLLASIYIDLAINKKQFPKAKDVTTELKRKFNNSDKSVTNVISSIDEERIYPYTTNGVKYKGTEIKSLEKNIISDIGKQVRFLILSYISD